MTDKIKSGGELQPCPFCGGEARLYSVSLPMMADCADIQACCTECDTMGPCILFDQAEQGEVDIPDLEAEAIAAWNRRTPAKAGEDGDHIADAGEKLREAVAEVLEWRIGELPDKGYIRDNDHSRAAIAKMAAALHGDQEG